MCDTIGKLEAQIRDGMTAANNGNATGAWWYMNEALSLLSQVREEMEAKPIWGVWVDYNRAPPGSYACLVSTLVNGEWGEPEAKWMPAQGRPPLPGKIRIMPHLMPNDPLTALKETTDV